MKQKTLGIAVVGYGGMGGWHTGTIRKLPELILCGIYDIDPARSEAAGREGISAYASLEELLADPAVHVVTIATPNDTHLPIARKAMQAGKHVVCEKPVALNSGELAEMIDCAGQCGVLFTVHQNRRWDEDFLIAKRLYEEGTLGQLFGIESRVHGSRGIPGDWRGKKEHGGGMVLDWGVHLIDQLLMMVCDRRLESVFAQLSHVTNEVVDDGFRALLQFSGGLTALLEVGTSNFTSLPRWYILGQNGTAVIRDWDLSGEVVMVSDWEKRDAVPVVTAAGLTKTMAPRTEETIRTYPLPAVQWDILDYYRNVRAAVFEGAALAVQPAEAMRVMRVMETIFASAQHNQTVYFEDDVALPAPVAIHA